MKKKVPKETFDSTFSIQPSLLTSEDWALTFSIDRFSPTGLLLEKCLNKLETGYTSKEGKYIKGFRREYDIDDMVHCLETDAELNSKERGFKQDSVRALTSRLEAAKSWGIFSKEGTPLTKFSRENQLTVIDTSFLDDNVTALVIGVLARRLLAARKISTRQEAVKKMEIDSNTLLEMSIPPTWLFIDEAHTLMPAGNSKTAATDALIEYVKQGRRPGCSLVFATQQPSAINSKVLSQIDILLAHKLVFDDDIKAVLRRVPAIMPAPFKQPDFVKTIEIGTALLADRADETSRAFIITIRPRMSQHEGREAETVEIESSLTQEQINNILNEISFKKVENEKVVPIKAISSLVEIMNVKYKAKTKLSAVLDFLETKNCVLNPEYVALNQLALTDFLVEGKEDASLIKEENTTEDKTTNQQGIIGSGKQNQANQIAPEKSLLGLPIKVNKIEANSLIEKQLRKSLLGVLGEQEKLSEINLVWIPVFKLTFDSSFKNESVNAIAFINSLTGEFIHFKENKLIESNGLSLLFDLNAVESKILLSISKKGSGIQELIRETDFNSVKIKNALRELASKKLVKREFKERKEFFYLNTNIELPSSRDILLSSLNSKIAKVSFDATNLINERFSEDNLNSILNVLWPKAKISSTEKIYLPAYQAMISSKQGKRKIWIDAFTGKLLKSVRLLH